MQNTRLSNEIGLYALAFGLALGLRLLNLGAAALSDYEASWALQALEVFRNRALVEAPQPAYLSLTAILFQLFGSTNFLARCWPALAGAGLVLAPYFVRQRLGRRAALIAAFGLALDPGLVAISRLAGGPALAVSATLLALALFLDRRPAATGILAGLALLSGPAVLTGALALGLAWLAARRLLAGSSPIVTEQRSLPGLWKTAALWAAGTIVLVSTLFFSFPQGLGIWANTLPEYFQGWRAAAELPGLRLLVALPVYQPLAFLLALAGVIGVWRRRERFAAQVSLWLLLALLLALAYPARQVADLAWVLVPLWLLAAVSLARIWGLSTYRLTVWGQAGAFFMLLALVWLNLQGLDPAIPESAQLRWVIIGGTLLLAALISLLIAMGWSIDAAQEGLAWGLVFGLGAYVLANVFWVSQLRPNDLRELWYPAPTVTQGVWLQDTLDELALTASGVRQQAEMISLVDAPAMRWLLRSVDQIQYQQILLGDELPAIIITPLEYGEIHQSMAYSGQDFAWRQSPAWQGSLPSDWLSWVIDREMPVVTDTLVIWARSDLFPDELLREPQPALESEVDDPAGIP